MKVTVFVAGVLAALLVAPAAAQAGSVFPTEVPLPNGFAPEGIAVGPGSTAYFGSRETGALYRTDLRTGQGSIIYPGQGTPSLGIKIDAKKRLFVAGGAGGDIRVHDSTTGNVIKKYQVSGLFVNDVVLTGDAAYFTDSLRPVVYKVPFGPGGQLPNQAVTIPLSGAITYQDGINANGIERTPDGKALLLVQSNTGKLFRINPANGVTTEVNLGTGSVFNGDGLLLDGCDLYVVQNFQNTLTVVQLNWQGTSGQVVRGITDPRFDVPTTVAAYGDRLYLPNGRFTTPVTPTTPYSVIAVKDN